MTKVDVKPLTNIDLLALIRTISLELENRECAVTKYVEREIPSTVETVEHEGKVLRKVNRKANDGDYVRFHNQKNRNSLKDDVIYGPINRYPGGTLAVKGYNVYQMEHNRTTETVEVFEVVDFIDEMPLQDIPIIKSHNQQRAELIQRAREFVEGQIDSIHCGYVIRGKKGVQHLCVAKFAHDFKKRTTTCTLVGISTGYTRKKAIVRCHPNEVFNEPLGEVVSLCKALEIDIPQEFLEAVQPVEKVIGMVVIAEEHVDGKHILIASGETLKNGYAHIGSPVGKDGKIIDDTNAEYYFESVGE